MKSALIPIPSTTPRCFCCSSPGTSGARARDQEELREIIRAELGEIPGVLTNFTQPIAMTVDELLEGVRPNWRSSSLGMIWTC